MRALFLLVLCVVAGCVTVAAAPVEDRGHGYFRLAVRGEGGAGVLYQQARQTAEAHCAAAKGGAFTEMARSEVQPRIDLSDIDTVQLCFRCDGGEGPPPRRDAQQMFAACGVPYGWPVIGYR